MSKPAATDIVRRELLLAGASLGVAAWLPQAASAAVDTPILKTIPGSGEKLPVIGLGTNQFREAQGETLRQVLARFSALGASMIDTAASYGESEQVIGRLLAELKLRDKLFLATKFTAGGGGGASFTRSLERLKTDHIDLLYVHNMSGVEALLPQMLEWKRAKKIRYLGISTAFDGQHAEMVAYMKKYPLDFVQVNYGLGGRDSERSVLQTASERQIAVVANVPLGGRGGRNLQAVLGKPLPAWAAEIGCSSWAQVMLKYVISHPAVTCVISGSTKVAHIEDNQMAGRGVVPDVAMRRRIEQYWDSLG